MALHYNFVSILSGGQLALSQRPKVKEISQLVAVGCDRIVTILSLRDQPQGIGKQADLHHIKWDWLKIAHANTMTIQEKALFKKSIQQVYNAILSNELVLVHCSAGLHRTGMFAYALLRKGGLDQATAPQIIKEIRPETQEALEDKYLQLAETLF